MIRDNIPSEKKLSAWEILWKCIETNKFNPWWKQSNYEETKFNSVIQQIAIATIRRWNY